MRTWIRVVIPVHWISILLLVYFPFAVASEVARANLGQAVHVTIGGLNLAAIAYGIYRVAAFHPVLRSDYRNWLLRTPWTPSRPLPLGPIHLVPQDVLMALLLTLLAIPEMRDRAVEVPLAMLVAYLAMLNVTFFLCRQYLPGYVMAFGLGLLLLLAQQLEMAWGIAAGLLLFSVFGIRRSMAAFRTEMQVLDSAEAQGRPWKLPMEFAEEMGRSDKVSLGWPFGWLKPSPETKEVSIGHGILISLLGGWFAFASLSNADLLDRRMFSHFCTYGVCVILSFGRLFTYTSGYLPPISLWGRIVTRRWIVPGYDKVFVASALTFAILPAATYGTLGRGNDNPEVIAGVSICLGLLATLLIGPGLRKWRLTGNHRMSPVFALQKTGGGAPSQPSARTFVEV